MTRSVLQPIRSRRVSRAPSSVQRDLNATSPKLSPATRKTIAAIGALWLSFTATSSGTPANLSSASAPAPAAVIESGPASGVTLERGRYLVEGVGLCADCHTPRTEKGEFDRTKWLLGSALSFQPTVTMPWSPAAPPIAGLPSMTEAQGVVFLSTGKRPDGSRPRPPMPEYRLNTADAAAVVAYLKSLTK